MQCNLCATPVRPPGIVIDGKVHCATCGPAVVMLHKPPGSRPPGARGPRTTLDFLTEYHECEECGDAYPLTPNWSNRSICSLCENEIRKELGEPAIDADLTPDERRYLQESFGYDVAPDPETAVYEPFCRSCVVHGANRAEYPCLREGSCYWTQSPQQMTITLHASTSNFRARVQEAVTNFSQQYKETS